MTTHPHDEALTRRIGNNLRAKRRALGLSQEELGQRCGLHRTYVGTVERGEKHITVITLNRLARAVGEPIEHFFRTDDAELG